MSHNPDSEYQKDYGRRAREGFIWMASSTALWQVISWVMTLLTTRFLVPEDYGIMAMNDILYPYLMMVSCLSLNSWIVQTSNLSEEAENTTFSLLLISGLISSLVAFFGASFIALYFREPRAEIVFQVCAIVYFVRGCQVIPESRLKRELRFKPIAIMNIVLGTLRGLLQIGMAYAGFGYWALAVGGIFREVGYLISLVTVAGLPRKIAWDRKTIKESLNFGLAASGASIFWIIFSSADNVIVGRLFGTEVLGFYAMAFYLAEMPLSKLNAAINPILTPYFSRIKNDLSALRASFLRTTGTVVAIVAPTLLGMSIVSPSFIPLALGDKWLGTIVPLQVLAVVGLLRAISNTGSSLIYAIGKPQLMLKWAASNALILPIAFYLFGTIWGIQGIYLSWLVVFPFTGILQMMTIYRKILGISYAQFIGSISASLVSSIIMMCCCYAVGFLSDNLIVKLCLQCFIGMASYVVAHMLLFKQQTNIYLNQLRQLKPKTSR